MTLEVPLIPRSPEWNLKDLRWDMDIYFYVCGYLLKGRKMIYGKGPYWLKLIMRMLLLDRTSLVILPSHSSIRMIGRIMFRASWHCLFLTVKIITTCSKLPPSTLILLGPHFSNIIVFLSTCTIIGNMTYFKSVACVV